MLSVIRDRSLHLDWLRGLLLLRVVRGIAGSWFCRRVGEEDRLWLCPARPGGHHDRCRSRKARSLPGLGVC